MSEASVSARVPKAPPVELGDGTARDLTTRTGTARLGVRKTYKLYVGGAFPRSESGRSYPVRAADGSLLAYAAQASRKDLRDAVVAARAAVRAWSGTSPYNRGQVLYRIAEMLEGRREQFVTEVGAAENVTADSAAAQVDAAIDRWVYYAGWTDKFAQVTGASNPVSGPYVSFSSPEPTGVVGLFAPQESSLLGLVSVLAPVLTTGNTAVLIASQDRPLSAVSLAEALATADLPAGTVNILTGSTAELAPWAAAHRDINALDLTGVAAQSRPALQRAGAGNLKRVYAPRDTDWLADPRTGRLSAFVEIKTVWHSKENEIT
ncbi:MAG TPA: aldehyde dehydrogenase family protein [Streptosporangiaceae bacterium]|nr:aldehyde dehydrogenase family protein [Streptosporangiaceae bacterium]